MEKSLKPIRDALDKFFFSNSTYNTLGLLRIGLCFWIFKPYLLSQPVHFPNETYLYEGAYEAPILIRMFSLPFPITGEQLYCLHLSLFVVSGLACLGILTRITVFLTGFLQMYLASISNSSGVFNHEVSLSCQILIFIAFVPGVQSLSLDRLFRWAHKPPGKLREPLWPAFMGPSVSGWGTKCILILLAGVYFSAGVSKMRFTGWHWLDGQTLSYYLSEEPSVYRKTDIQHFIGNDSVSENQKWKDGFGIYAHNYGNHKPPVLERKFGVFNTIERNIGRIVTEMPGMAVLLSVGTVLFELATPLLLLGGWYRNVILVIAICVHQIIGILMGLPFYPYKVVCFFMLDWELIIKALDKRMPVFRHLDSRHVQNEPID